MDMLHIQCFPTFSKEKLWTIYVPKVEDDTHLAKIAQYVHKTFRKRMEERKSEFTIGFIPEKEIKGTGESDATSFDWEGYHYVVMTKDIDQVFMSLPELVNVDHHITVFVAPQYLPEDVKKEVDRPLDVVMDAQRIFFVVTMGILFLSWLYTRFVNQ